MQCSRNTVVRMETKSDSIPDISLKLYDSYAEHTNTTVEELLFDSSRRHRREMDLMKIKVELMRYIDDLACNTDK